VLYYGSDSQTVNGLDSLGSGGCQMSGVG